MPFEDPRLSQFPQVCIVEASAGSGKTYALAKRYISLLINPGLVAEDVPLKNILAITFSNKAALEMKERILEFLKRIALDEFSSLSEKEDILSSLRTDFPGARKKAYRIMDEIIRNYNFFQVQTIDSFINAILSGCAFQLDLSAGFKIKTDSSDHLAYALDRLIDRAGSEKKIHSLMRGFLTQYLFLENKSSWFPRKDILSIVSSLFADNNRFGVRFKAGPADAQDVLGLKKRLLADMKRLEGELPPGTHASFKNSFSSFLKGAGDTFDIAGVSKYFSRESIPVTKGHKAPAKTEKLWLKISRALTELAEAESASLFNYYIEIFDNVLADFRALANKEDTLFLDELNTRARMLFDERLVTVPELYYRLAVRLKHFLIDEFQDTSRLQWQNLFLMVEEALSTGGSLFYVGDKKQAIYRFRGGEVALFDSVKERFGDFNLITWPLSVNYRSQKEIVAFSNMVFCEDNLGRFLNSLEFSRDEADTIIDVFKGAQQTYLAQNCGGYVRLEPIDAKNKEERNAGVKERLLALIGELRKRFDLKDIALLTRQNDDVELLTEWLLESEIPVESEKTLNVRNNASIKELVSFLKFLNSPIDDLSFASFILGDIFSLASKLENGKIHDFIFDVRQRSQKQRGVYLYREFRRVFPDAWEGFIEEFFKNVGFVPLYELTVSILQKFRCLENFHGYQGFFMRFLELIKEKEEDSPSLSLFLDFFEKSPDEELYVSVCESNAVKVLTIHKAKGLGFPVVLIPFFEMQVRVEADTVQVGEDKLTLQRIGEKYRMFSQHLEELYRQEYRGSFIDELNSIYVALTRPMQELYLFIPRSAARGPNLAALLIPEEPLEMGCKAQEKPGKKAAEKLRPIDIPISQYKDWIQLLKDEFKDEPLLLIRSKVVRGEALHAALSFMGDLNRQDKESCLIEAFKKARLRYPFIEEWKELQACVRRLIEDKKFKPFFFLEGGCVYQEKEIVDPCGNTRRIDRLIVQDSEVVVIDYKSSKEEGLAHQEQVREYGRLLCEIYPKQSIKKFIVYLDDLSLVEVDG